MSCGRSSEAPLWEWLGSVSTRTSPPDRLWASALKRYGVCTSLEIFDSQYPCSMPTLFPSNVAPSSDEGGERDEIVIDGKSFVLDEHAADVLRSVLEALQRGASVEISEATEFISTQAAADMLGISRPSLVKMLDAGVIASQRPGSHRRVRRADVEAFIDARAPRRATAMEELHASHTPQDDSLKGFVSTR